MIESLAALAKYDTKHNPIIIAMFLSCVRVFVRVSIAKEKKGKGNYIPRTFSAMKNKLSLNNRETPSGLAQYPVVAIRSVPEILSNDTFE